MVPRSTLDELAGWGCFACEMHLLRETSSILRLVEKYIVDFSRSNCRSGHLLYPGYKRIESGQVSALVVC